MTNFNKVKKAIFCLTISFLLLTSSIVFNVVFDVSAKGVAINDIFKNKDKKRIILVKYKNLRHKFLQI